MVKGSMTQQNTVLITGGSGGIGYELAKVFARNHYDVVLVARNGAKLKEAVSGLERECGATVSSIVLDLSDAAAPRSLFDELRRKGVEVDILVNNAGYGKYGYLSDVSLEESLGQILLNVAALTALTTLFIGPMLERHAGKIMNVASTAGFQPGPGMAVYYAAKAYVILFSEALAHEVKDKGVTVTCLCPGVTATGFQERARMKGLSSLPAMDAAVVARAGYRAMLSGKKLVIPGFFNGLVARLVPLIPRRLVTSISGKLLEERPTKDSSEKH